MAFNQVAPTPVEVIVANVIAGARDTLNDIAQVDEGDAGIVAPPGKASYPWRQIVTSCSTGDEMDSPEEGNKAEYPGRTGLQPRAAPWPKVTSDYHGALVRLTTMRAAKARYLLFGYVELFPRDTPVPEGFNAGDRPWTVPNFGGDVTLGVSALPMSVAAALAWYDQAAIGQVTIPRAIPVALA